jgi:hypothetical protein
MGNLYFAMIMWRLPKGAVFRAYNLHLPMPAPIHHAAVIITIVVLFLSSLDELLSCQFCIQRRVTSLTIFHRRRAGLIVRFSLFLASTRTKKRSLLARLRPLRLDANNNNPIRYRNHLIPAKS